MLIIRLQHSPHNGRLASAAHAASKQTNKPIMKKYIITGLAAVVAATSAAVAGTEVSSKKVVIPMEDPCRFRDQEFQIDAYGQGAFYDTGRPGWGGGLGLTYYFSRYIGIGVEQGLFGRNDRGSSSYTEWNTLGNLFLRYPICSWNLAPYAMVGGGGFYGTGQGRGAGVVGGGLEYRFTDNIGTFWDARYVYSGESPNSAVLSRVGLRFAF